MAKGLGTTGMPIGAPSLLGTSPKAPEHISIANIDQLLAPVSKTMEHAMSHQDQPAQTGAQPTFPHMPEPQVNYSNLVDLGFSLIPIVPREKRPSIRSWKEFQARRPTPAEIQKWSSQLSNNVGIVTGKISNCFVLDIDDKDVLDDLKRRGLPETLTAGTSKGYHFFFKHPGFTVQNATKIIPGCDIRGDGGYVVAAGSIHPTGDQYRWVNEPTSTPISEAPAWLLQLISPRARGKIQQAKCKVMPKDLKKKYASILAELRDAEHGSRNDTLNRCAFFLGQLIGANYASEQAEREVLQGAAAQIGLSQDEAFSTIESGLTAGKANCSGIAAGMNDPDRLKPVDRLIGLAGSAELFKGTDGAVYATYSVKNHKETQPVRSKSFKLWLYYRYFELTRSAPPSEALNAALSTIESRANFEGGTHPVFLRVGEHAGKYYVDLANEDWDVVEIDSDSWRIVSDAPVKFRRSPNMEALPRPVVGESINALRKFINVKTDADFHLLVAWLLASLRCKGPYPAIVLSGEQGSAKSTCSRILRKLIDPARPELRSLASQQRDLIIGAINNHVQAFDNVSFLSNELSDALCQLSTGGGYSTRALYSDQEEMRFEGTRPILMNGIEDFVRRSDLAERALFVRLAPIEEKQRKVEADLFRDFQLAHAGILGALLDAIVIGIRNLPTTRLADLPRMADFVLFVTACEPTLFSNGAFAAAVKSNRANAVDTAIDNDPISAALRTLMTTRTTPWEGTASSLLSELSDHVGADVILRSKSWPKTPQQLSGNLRRAATNLRAVGITLEFTRNGRDSQRNITIVRCAGAPPYGAKSPSASSASSPRHEMWAPRPNSTTDSDETKLPDDSVLWDEIFGK